MYKKQLICVIQVILLLFVINFSVASAETVILKSGERIEGKIIEKTDRYLRIEIIEDVPVTYWLDEVERIEEEAPLSPQVAVPEPPLDRSETEKYLSEAEQYYRQGKYEDALTSLNEAVKLDSNNVGLRISLAILYYYLGRFGEAISSLQDVLTLQSHAPDVYLLLGIIYDYAGFSEKAKETLLKSLEQFKEEVDVVGAFIVETLLDKISKNNKP